MRRLFAVPLLLALAAMTAFAQAPAEPDYFMAAGAGFNQSTVPQVNGFLSFGAKIASGTYSYSTTEYTKVNSTIRTGIARTVFTSNGLTLMALGDGGVTTTEGAGSSGSLAGSFSFGGVAIYDISKIGLKIPGTYLMFSVRPTKNNVPEAIGGGFNTAFHFGIAKSF